MSSHYATAMNGLLLITAIIAAPAGILAGWLIRRQDLVVHLPEAVAA